MVVGLVLVTALVGVGAGIFIGGSLIHGASSSAATSIPGAGNGVLTTPENSVKEYLDGVAANDADRILGACGSDLVAKNYQFELAAERVNAIVSRMLAPSQYTLYRTMDEYQQADRCLSDVWTLAYILLTSEPYD